MRLLVLGGTEFVGRAVVEAALRRGWEVTVFHRGRLSELSDVRHGQMGDRGRTFYSPGHLTGRRPRSG
ncbi:NAD-dependent epimerase/dehydratase family protein, partial [Streptomyces sp. NPDC004457]